MKHIWLIGTAAGLATALLFLSAGAAPGGGFLGFFIPLPSLIAGLGWGWPVAGIAGLAGAVFVFILTAPVGGFIYALICALPITFICYLVGLNRQSSTGDDLSPDGTPKMHWYPLSRIFVWMTVIAGCLAALGVLALGPGDEAYRSNLEPHVDRMIEKQIEPIFQRKFSPKERRTLAQNTVNLLPAMIAISWLATLVLNTWLAGRIVRSSGRLDRPVPELRQIGIEPVLIFGLLAAVALVIFGGFIGRIGMSFAGAALFAFLLIGLAVLHEVTIGNPMRPLILGFLYGGMIMLGMLFAPPIILLGIAEPLFHLRARAQAKRGSTPPPP